MTLSVYDVTLVGADPKGRFQEIYRVLAFSNDTAETLARASAALKDFAVIESSVAATDFAPPEEGPDDFPRVISTGQRNYTHLHG